MTMRQVAPDDPRGQITLSVAPRAPQLAPAAPCARCRKHFAVHGRKSCASCLEYDRIKAQIRRDSMREQGRCLVCGRPCSGTRVLKGQEVPLRHCPDHVKFYRWYTRKGSP